MKLPWLQVAEEVFERAEGLADVLQLESDDVVLGRLLKLWKAAMGWGDPNKPPDGIVKGAHAAQRIASAFRWKGSPDLLIEALTEFGFLEAIRGGFRVRGLSRYKSAFFRNKNLRSDGTARPPRGNRAETASLDGEGDRDLDQEVTGEEDRTYVADDLPPPPESFEPTPPRPPPSVPSPATIRATQGSVEQLIGLWRALEEARGAIFGTVPRAKPPAKAYSKLQAFWEGHGRDTGWCLDTQARWINRDRSWVANLDPEGATEVLLDESQWPRFRRARPSEEKSIPVGTIPDGPVGELWAKVIHALQEDGKVHALSWLIRCSPLELTAERFVLGVPDRYFRNWAVDHYGPLLDTVLEQLGESRDVEFRAPEEVAADCIPEADGFTQARAAA